MLKMVKKPIYLKNKFASQQVCKSKAKALCRIVHAHSGASRSYAPAFTMLSGVLT